MTDHGMILYRGIFHRQSKERRFDKKPYWFTGSQDKRRLHIVKRRGEERIDFF